MITRLDVSRVAACLEGVCPQMPLSPKTIRPNGYQGHAQIKHETNQPSADPRQALLQVEALNPAA